MVKMSLNKVIIYSCSFFFYLLQAGLLDSKVTKHSKAHKKTPVSTKKSRNLSLKEVKALQKDMQVYDAMSLLFKETLYRHLRKKTLYKKGSAYFIKPNKFKWQVEPVSKKAKSLGKEIWLYDGKDLLQYSTKENYAVRYKSNIAKGKELKQLVDMITDLKALLESYTFKSAHEKDNFVTVNLEPKGSSDIRSVSLILSWKFLKKRKQVFMKNLSLFFKDNNSTSFEFYESKKEKVDLAKLKLPKGVKVTNALE